MASNTYKNEQIELMDAMQPPQRKKTKSKFMQNHTLTVTK